MTHQVIFFAFSCALPTELCPPIRSVGLEPTCHVTEVFETSLYTYSSMTACGIGLIRSVPVCVKNSGNNTNSHFISQVSTFYYTCDLLCVLFSSACPRQGCVRTRLSLFQDTEYRRMTIYRNRTGIMNQSSLTGQLHERNFINETTIYQMVSGVDGNRTRVQNPVFISKIDTDSGEC